MQAVRAYYDEGKFVPMQPVRIPKGSQAIVTILDFAIGEVKPIIDDTPNKPSASRIEWLNRLEAAIDDSEDEELPDWPFQRSKEMRLWETMKLLSPKSLTMR